MPLVTTYQGTGNLGICSVDCCKASWCQDLWLMPIFPKSAGSGCGMWVFTYGATYCRLGCGDCSLVRGTGPLATPYRGDQPCLAALPHLGLDGAPVLCAPTRGDAGGSRRRHLWWAHIVQGRHRDPGAVTQPDMAGRLDTA